MKRLLLITCSSFALFAQAFAGTSATSNNTQAPNQVTAADDADADDNDDSIVFFAANDSTMTPAPSQPNGTDQGKPAQPANPNAPAKQNGYMLLAGTSPSPAADQNEQKKPGAPANNKAGAKKDPAEQQQQQPQLIA